MTRQQLKAMAKEQIKGKIGILFLISLVISLVSAAISFVPFGSLILTPALTLSTYIIYLNIANTPENKPEVKDAFSGLSNIWGAFKVYFAQFFFTYLWMLLFIIPGIIKSFAYSQAWYILAEEPSIGARAALKKSEQMMKGYKTEYFILSLSFIGWILLSLLTFGILLIWVIPYMQATLANFYNSIKPVNPQTIENAQFV